MMDGVGTRMDMWVGGTELSPGTDPPVYGQFQQRYEGQFQKFNGERVVFSVNMLGGKLHIRMEKGEAWPFPPTISPN